MPEYVKTSTFACFEDKGPDHFAEVEVASVWHDDLGDVKHVGIP